MATKPTSNKDKERTALIVDDDRDFIAIATKMLAALGFKVQSATDEAGFLTRFTQRPPEVCLIDLKLGSAMGGFDLLTKLRVDHHTKIPLLVVSAETDSKIIAHAIELGATNYIVKPLDAEKLAAKLSPHFFDDEAVEAARPPYYAIPKDQGAATLSVDFALRSVDEYGITLESPSLVTKGTAVQVSSPIMAQMTGRGETHLMTVANSWAEPDRQIYCIYCEFDSAAEDVLTAVRRWLLSRASAS